MPTYKKMQTVPIKWLHRLPSHWQYKKLGALFTERKEKVSDKLYPPLSVTKFGIVPQLSDAVKTDNGDDRKLVKKGDIVINSRSDRKGACGLAPQDGSVSLINIVLIPKNTLNPKYIHYLLRSIPFSEEFFRYGTGIVDDLWSTRYSEMKNISLPIPPFAEQTQIAYYLDWKSSQINVLINFRKQEISELHALKFAVVSDAVTHGLNHSVPVRFSGIHWLGNIPAHWQIKKLRQLLHPVSIKNRPNLPLLSVVRERGIILRDIHNKKSNHNYIPDDLSKYKVAQKGQFVINKMKSWQGSYGISPYTGIVSPAYFVFNIDFNNLDYFHFAIRSKVYVNFFAQASDGIRVGQWDLQMDRMKEIPFIIPPEKEQEEIVEYIKHSIPQYDDAIQKLTEEIHALHEYQSKLISDVVTGQIDVRNIKIPQYEYTEEVDLEEQSPEKEEDMED